MICSGSSILTGPEVEANTTVSEVTATIWKFVTKSGKKLVFCKFWLHIPY